MRPTSPIKELRAVLGTSGGERGIVLVSALLVMIALLPLGAIFVALSHTEAIIASNEVTAAKSFNIAEAGLELTKRTLKMSPAPSLNVYLTGTSPGPYPFGDTPGAGNSLAGGNYIVRIYDNNDDGDPTNDTDNMVFVEATGSYRNAQKRLVALVQVPLVPTPDGSVEMISPGGETEVELEKGAWIDGRDWDPPADPSACTSIATCGTLTGNPAVAGVSSSTVDNEVDVKGSSILDGAPPSKVNTTLSTTPWDNLIDQLIGQAARNLTVPETLTGTHTWGTPAAPEITVISSPEIRIKDPTTVVNGAGVLIIANLAELKLDHGTLNWQGLIIVRGNGELEVEFDDDNDATARIFGALVLMTTGADPELEAEIENANSFIKYCGSAIDKVRSFLPLTVQSWREVSM